MSCKCTELEDRLACLENKAEVLQERDEQLNDRLNDAEAQLRPLLRVFEDGVYAFVADQGEPNATQTAVALKLDLMNADGVFFGGDNQYADGATDLSFAAFDGFSAGKQYPVPGNHDYDDDAASALFAKFPLLFEGGQQYYDVEFDKGDIHLFCLSTMVDGALNVVGTGGNTIGSDQYQWFTEKIKASKRKWKVVMLHHPPFSLRSGGTPVGEMDWVFEKLGVHLILCGHEHALWHVRKNGLDWINVSTASQAPSTFIANVSTDPTQIIGQNEGCWVVWKDASNAGKSSAGGYCKLTGSVDTLNVKIYKASDGSNLYDYNVR